MKYNIGTIDGQDGFFTVLGGWCVSGDGDKGIVTYDTDVLRRIENVRTVEGNVFDRVPAHLYLADGTFLDDEISAGPLAEDRRSRTVIWSPL